MEKYKICPSCGEKNYPGLLECLYCEADLAGVRITDDESEAKAKEASAASGKDAYLVRLCDCGAKNPPNARKCVICGEDISDVIPTPDKEDDAKEAVKEESLKETLQEELSKEETLKEESIQEDSQKESDTPSANEPSPLPEEETPLSMTEETAVAENETAAENETVAENEDRIPEEEKASVSPQKAEEALPATILNDKVAEALGLKARLRALDGTYEFVLHQGETVVGRSGAMGEYLMAKPYVSRIHCRFILEENGLFLENLSATNYTFKNNQMVTGRVPLSDGDEVGMGGLVSEGKRQERAAYFRVKLKP